MTVGLAITLGSLNPKSWRPVALAADEGGLDAVFVSDHVVAPVRIAGRLGMADEAEERQRMSPATPLYDPIAYCSYLAGQTGRVHLGTYVYLLGLRHPFVAARGFATLDVVSDGRALLGVGAGWHLAEWDAVGVAPQGRGRRLDEAIEVCRRLWTEEIVEHHGAHFSFEAVGFEPKPRQPGGVPILVGGESEAALDRAARLGDGWMGMGHTPASAAARVADLARRRRAAGREDHPFSVTVGGTARTPTDLDEWEAAGVDRLVVTPWTSSRSALDELRGFLAQLGDGLRRSGRPPLGAEASDPDWGRRS